MSLDASNAFFVISRWTAVIWGQFKNEHFIALRYNCVITKMAGAKLIFMWSCFLDNVDIVVDESNYHFREQV